MWSNSRGDTITAHHLYLTVDDVLGNAYHFCKPVAKLRSDRNALLKAAASGNPKFFFGSDSAPHTTQAKHVKQQPAAGVFTQPYATQLVLDAFELAYKGCILKEEDDIAAEILENFLGGFGRSFYRAPDKRKERTVLKKGDEKIVEVVKKEGEDIEIVPFRRGQKTWSVIWK